MVTLIRARFCTALTRALNYQFKSKKFWGGSYHIWDFLEDVSKGAPPTASGKLYQKIVVQLNSIANDPNVKFRNFVCASVTYKTLPDWLSLMAESAQKWFESDAVLTTASAT